MCVAAEGDGEEDDDDDDEEEDAPEDSSAGISTGVPVSIEDSNPAASAKFSKLVGVTTSEVVTLAARL